MRILLAFIIILAAVVALADEPNGALDEVLYRSFHRTSILTFAGVKPISTIDPSDYFGLDSTAVDEAKKWERALSEAVDDGIIRNNEIHFWFLSAEERQALKSAGGESMSYSVHVVNKASLERLIKDQELLGLYKRYGITVPVNLEEALALYKRAVLLNGYAYYGPTWANIVIGTFLGYPPADVESYSLVRLTGAEKQKNSYAVRLRDAIGDPVLSDQFPLDGYNGFTQGEVSRVRRNYLMGSSRKTILNYLALKKKGMTDLQILNQSELLKVGLPQYPKILCLSGSISEWMARSL